MYATKQALPQISMAPRFSSTGDHPVPNAKSDREIKFFYDEGGREIPKSTMDPIGVVQIRASVRAASLTRMP